MLRATRSRTRHGSPRSTVVAPRHMLLAYDLVPAGDAWRVEARVGVEMLAHEDAACDVSASMLEVESWLSREISR